MATNARHAEDSKQAQPRMSNRAMIYIGVAILSLWVGLLLSGSNLSTPVVILGALFLGVGLLARFTRNRRGNPDER